MMNGAHLTEEGGGAHSLPAIVVDVDNLGM